VSFLVVLRPHRPELPHDPTPEENEIVEAHFDYLSGLRDDGKLLLAGPSIAEDDTFGIAILTVEERDEAEALVAADPAVTGGIMLPEVRPLRISIR
jgi:uncharacterized protein YciI